MDFSTPEAYPGHNEDINLEEYESIKDKINEKHNCNMTALQVRSEFEKTYNKLFDTLMQEHSHEVFNILYVMMDCFNIDEIKAVRYLNKTNKEKVRSFAVTNCNTNYYEKLEQRKLKAKAEKKGKTFFEHNDIGDMFE
jgi:hypothetical protein